MENFNHENFHHPAAGSSSTAQKEDQEREIAENWAFLDKKKSVKWNWQQVCANKFSFPVKVRKTTFYRDTVHILEVATAEQREEVSKLLRTMRNDFSYYTGEQIENDYGQLCSVVRNRLGDHAGENFLNAEPCVY